MTNYKYLGEKEKNNTTVYKGSAIVGQTFYYWETPSLKGEVDAKNTLVTKKSFYKKNKLKHNAKVNIIHSPLDPSLIEKTINRNLIKQFI
ncbi:hypothetical protein [Fictibacillus fluitans]|uniref:Uncharacterized protein n=1 Tax=Fictibacillus fluitans TaxID=3058422 RepID=A0ABT8HRP7_9BACL|nr:hypothetical protein [Fictibacillus sp. NE201]MDN4523190.1 hypothetical protein [Fictibacillus sp. NE201]